MGLTDLFIVLVTGVLAILVSFALDLLWARVSGAGSIYFLVRTPGIIVHECSHILGCLLTGAKVTRVVFISKTGGSVTYTRSPVPFLGDVIINSAPLFCIPLFLYGCTWVFTTFLGCSIPVLTISSGSAGAIPVIAGRIAGMFVQNLVTRFNPWFLLYLYLTLSLVLSLAPSAQDVKNAAAGIVLIALVCAAVVWSGIPFLVSLLDQILGVVGTGLGLGLGFEILALVISLPLVVLYSNRR